MPWVTVFRFEYLDRATGERVAADDLATAYAIQEMGATSILGSAMRIGAGRASRSGIAQRGDDWVPAAMSPAATAAWACFNARR